MTPLIRAAGELAIRAHSDHKNEHTGEPYLIHLWRVVCSAMASGESEEIVAACWLHDAYEDKKATLQEIEQATNREVMEIVLHMSKTKGQDVDDYYYGLRSYPKSARAKWHDLMDNFPKNHLLDDDSKRLRMSGKYSLGMDILKDFAPGRPLVV